MSFKPVYFSSTDIAVSQNDRRNSFEFSPTPSANP